MFPESRAGNRVLQVWTFAADPSNYYITTGPNHTAQNSWNGFVSFAQQAGITVPNNMINSGITIRTDGGTEFTGSDFQIPCKKAGIIHSVSTPYKKSGQQGHAEGSAKAIQFRIRAITEIAKPNFKQFGIDPRQYWDDAASYASLQDRATRSAIQGTTTHEQIKRTVPAAWGSLCTVTLQPHGPQRSKDHKQLTSRGTKAIFLNYQDRKYTVVLPDHTILRTTDVIFRTSLNNETDHPGDTNHTDGEPTPTPEEDDTLGHTEPEPASPEDTPDNATNELHEGQTSPGTTTGIRITEATEQDLDYNGDPYSPEQTPAHEDSNELDFNINADTDTETYGLETGQHPSSQQTSNTDHQELLDRQGNSISPGDQVEVFWPKMDTSWTAKVTNIMPDEDQYIVDYGKQHGKNRFYRHLISEAPHQLMALITRQPIVVNPTVSPYITSTGDIRRDILQGTTQLPTAPPLPNLSANQQHQLPNTITEALTSPFALYWLHAIVKEYSKHLHPTMTTQPPSFHYGQINDNQYQRKIYTKWTFVIKFIGNKIEKFKARMVIAGSNLQQNLHYLEKYCPTPPVGDLYLLESIAQIYDLNVFEDDQEMAFVHNPMAPTPQGKQVIVHPAQGTRTFHNEKPEPLVIDQALYGWPSSGNSLAVNNQAYFLNEHQSSKTNPCPIPFVQCPNQPCIYRAEFPQGHEFEKGIFILFCYVDNHRCYVTKNISTKAYSKFRKWFQSICTITGSGQPLQLQAPQQCLGTQISYKADSTTISMKPFIEKALSRAGMSRAHPSPTPLTTDFQLDSSQCPTTDAERNNIRLAVNSMFAEALDHVPLQNWVEVKRFYARQVSTIGWIAQRVAPIISAAHSFLGRVIHDPPKKAFIALKRVYSFLKGNTDLSITLSATTKLNHLTDQLPTFTIETDASFADDLSDRHSQGGYLGRLAQMGPCYWNSSKSKRICTSTTHSETYFGSSAAKHAMYVNNLLTFLQVNHRQPITMKMDSQSTVNISGSTIRRYTPKQKHFEIDDLYLAECVSRKKIQVIKVKGAPDFDDVSSGLPADALTKPMSKQLLRHYYRSLTGSNYIK